MKTIYEFNGTALRRQRSQMWQLCAMSAIFTDTRFDFGSPKTYYDNIEGWKL